MNSLLWNNLLIYCLQIGILVALASLLPPLLRLRVAAAKLAFWQLLLAASLLLPLLRPWRHEIVAASARVSTTVTAVQPIAAAHPSSISLLAVLPFVLAAGILVRLVSLAAGFWRLRRYRLQSRRLDSARFWTSGADLRISTEISSPVTFGYREPVVLLPARFSHLDAAIQDAILCHEMLHVWRRDWLFTIAEELIRAAFWFHPAIWWVLGEIQLAREQAVDSLVIDTVSSRDQYLDALLAIAGAAPGAPHLDLVPAPLFLRKRHLKHRIFSILKEVRMSKLRNLATLSASLAGLAAACWVVTGSLPLSAAPQTVVDANGISVELHGSQVMHRSSVVYPREALAAGVQGAVTLQVKLDATGNVSDASVVSGPEELRKAALQSVLTWHFTRDTANTTRQVTIEFHLPPPGPAPQPQSSVVSARLPHPIDMAPGGRISAIHINGLPDSAREEVLGKLNVHVGDTLAPETLGQVIQSVRQVDEHLNVSTRSAGPGEVALTISAPSSPSVMGGILSSVPSPSPAAAAGAVRVDPATQAAKLVKQPQPVYPPLAMQARVQGVVNLAAVIDADGRIADLQVLTGHPLLVAAALQAVREWVYQPAVMNGRAVAVSTTVQVNFNLEQ